MKLPMLFARTNTGAIQTWTIEVDGNKYRTHYGQLDGAIQITEWTLCVGKNTGKKNATSNEDQAVKEAKATWKKKKESGYFEKSTNGLADSFYCFITCSVRTPSLVRIRT